MQQKRGGETVDRHVHVREIAPSHAELAAEIVARCDARKHLDGAQWIVGQDATKILDVRAPQYLLGRDGRLGRTESIRGHGDGFRVGACALAERDRDVHRAASRHQHIASHEDVANHRHV